MGYNLDELFGDDHLNFLENLSLTLQIRNLDKSDKNLDYKINSENEMMKNLIDLFQKISYLPCLTKLSFTLIWRLQNLNPATAKAKLLENIQGMIVNLVGLEYFSI